MADYQLIPHPDFPSSVVTAITVNVERSIDFLHLGFVIAGDLDAVRWPAPVEPSFRDGLWQHTCFEAFCRVGEGAGYREVNLSPSGEWAVYDFSGYRTGMTRASRQPVRRFKAKLGSVVGVVDIGKGDWQLGLSAVIEATDGSKSYWALAHAPGKPDFHSHASFALSLPNPS